MSREQWIAFGVLVATIVIGTGVAVMATWKRSVGTVWRPRGA